ncbi:hypothetical protein INT48_002427 [Thamnidium elegans]|uniref:Ubiquitin-activating enzyme E1-like n=1 Tax=Thamnidium elegans TaxID=101142 RepID=A0A8H7VUK3_9FUNG|nr:hypothetical protein INT48_002427 [Thamnidium elegans]
MTSRDSYNIRVLGQELYDKVSSSKVLLIGAGGIGCELLKNLVMSGFKDIEVIDLDTIDISNLNRQFLFQKQHVKQAKAHVAKESAQKFNPSAEIKSLQCNIKEAQFSVQWFKQFTMVLNALDNLEARRHVNAMCLAADVPLVESGTQGYFGQAYVIKKDETECFDCQPKITPKTYPVCTIRSTPSEPIHSNEVAALNRETEELKAIKEAAGSPDYTKKIFSKVYETDIERSLTMESMWKNRQKPTPLHYDELENIMSDIAEKGGLEDRKVWDLKENFEVFKSSAKKLSTRLLKEREVHSDAILSFDKDDDDAMDFVTAASNLRAHIFGIEKNSLFDVKSMAGNIIPAIATTNAIISGLVILKAFGILRGEYKNNPRVYLHTSSRLISEANSDPNPNCSVCRSRSAMVSVDFEKATLRDLINQVLLLPVDEGGAGMEQDEIAIMDGSRMIYDVDFEDMADIPMKEAGLKPDTILRVTNDDGDEIDLIMEANNTEELIKLSSPLPKLVFKVLVKRKMEEESEEANKRVKTMHTIVDDVILLDLDNADDDIVLLD